MDKKVLNKHLEKLNEDIRNIQYQINSINQDIKKDKKQSYIEKRIDRLVNNYKMLNQKRQGLVNISREEKRELQEKVLEIRKQVKDVCYKGSKDVSKQNIQLDEVVNNESKSEIYNKIDDDENEKIKRVYGPDGSLEYIYIKEERPIGRWQKIKQMMGKKKKNKEIIKKQRNKNRFGKMKEFFREINGKKLLKRIAAFGMGALMLLPGTISANQNENNTESKSTKNSYIDTVKQTPVNEHELIKMAEDFKKENSLNMDENIKSEEAVKEENTNDKNENDVLVHIIAPAQSKYTEVSDGKGNYGIFTEDTEVSIYNRALIRTNKDGSKSILKATKVGQTWKQYAEEQGIDYNEFKTYIENNENIQEVLSTMSVDGKSIYGWMPASEFEYKTQDKEINVQRNYVTEVEER